MNDLKAWRLHPIRVRYQETDQMGVVFHSHYVNWFEIGRTEWIRNTGYTYRSIEEAGLLLPVIDLNCRFAAPAKYDDDIIICTRLAESTPLRVTFESQVRAIKCVDDSQRIIQLEDQLPGELLVDGTTKHVWVDRKFQPIRMNRVMPELYDLIGMK